MNHDYEGIDWDAENQPAEIDENTDISIEEIKEQSSPSEIDVGQNATPAKRESDPDGEIPEKKRPKHNSENILLFLSRMAASPPSTPEQRLEKITRLHRKYLKSDEADDTIFGEWHLHFPDLGEGFRKNGNIWKIHLPTESESCLWVVFHQSDIEGIIRLKWNTPENWKGKSFPFSFNGRETATYCNTNGDGHITFTSAHECSGTFNTEWDNPWTFVGMKVSNELPTMDRKSCNRAYERVYRHRKVDWRWD